MLKQVIEAQGVEVGEVPFRQYPELIRNIATAPIVLTHLAGSGSPRIYNKWNNTILVNDVRVGVGKYTTINFTEDTIGQKVLITAPDPNTFKSWALNPAVGLVQWVEGLELELSVPNLDPFLINGNQASYYFFEHFCDNTSITKISPGSFDTSKITKVSYNFFTWFCANNSRITELPEGSFDISNITQISTSFFDYFNYNGGLVKLPKNSFRLSEQLETVYARFFGYFNSYGKLTSLPIGSFDTTNIIRLGDSSDSFMLNFNQNGNLTEGNKLVPIYAFRKITGFYPSPRTVLQGQTIYVNGDEP